MKRKERKMGGREDSKRWQVAFICLIYTRDILFSVAHIIYCQPTLIDCLAITSGN